MIKKIEFKKSILSYEQDMKTCIEAAKLVTLPVPKKVSFCSKKISDAKILALSKKIPTGQRKEDKGSEFIYIFKVNSENKNILEKFNIARNMQSNKDYKYNKNLCQPNKCNAGTNILYVGRSYKPRERFKQHLKICKGRTYAMHMQAWALDLDMNVDFFVFQFRSVSDRVIQIIEDGLWDHLKPLLGKRGER